MQKTAIAGRPSHGGNRRLTKTFLVMNLTIVLLTAFFLNVSANGIAQKITFSGKEVPLEKVFAEVKRQTGYVFVYTDAVISGTRPVTLKVTDVPLDRFLAQLFHEQPIEFTFANKTILLSRKDKDQTPPAGGTEGKKDMPAPPFPVHGRLVDANGYPLAGITVSNRNSRRQTATGADGDFTILANAGDVLMLTSVAYESKEYRVLSYPAGTVYPTLTMTLSKKVSALDSTTIIVNTGYQKVSRDRLTGAATTVGEKEYHQREAVTGNFLESLEGKVPGLVYNSQSGELTIRGVSTFDAVKQPLIIVDGFPTEIDIRTINPDDILSVSVLRDAAAASIYGVRASNGVIVIETRRGKSGKAIFNLRSSLAYQAKPDFGYLKYAPASEYVQLQADNFYASKPNIILYQLGYYGMDPAQVILFQGPRPGVTNPVLTQDQVNAQLKALGSYDNLKEYENLFYRHRLTRNVNGDVSGGNDKSTYLLGFNYIGDELVHQRADNRQFILNMANTMKFSDRINFDFRGTYTNILTDSGGIVPYTDFLPYEHLADAHGNALPVALAPGRDFLATALTPAKNNSLMAQGLNDEYYYPYRELTSNTNTVKTNSERFQARINARITRWLNIDLGGDFENQDVINDQLQLGDAYAVRMLLNAMATEDPSTGKAVFSNMPAGDILKRTSEKITDYTVRGQLNFAERTGDHDISGILGIEQKRILNQGYTTSFFGYDGQTLISKPINMEALNATTFPVFDIGLETPFFNSTDYFNQAESDSRFMSYYGQGTYIYKGKYVATGSFRIDQSNVFGVDPKYKYKPLWSAGVNWRLEKEDFIKDIEWINHLQLRAATGFNGNIPASSNGGYLILNSALNTRLNTPLIYNDVLTPQNQSLRWETTKNYNIGLDYTILQDRVSGSVDWYLKKAVDVFGQFDADPTSGFNQYNANTASIQNKGLELMVNTVNIKKGWLQWRTQLTASFNNNQVLAVKSTLFSNSELIATGSNPIKGKPLGSLYSYNYGGLNSLGQPYVLDSKGNKDVLAFYSFGSPALDVTLKDMVYNGTTTPKYVLGLNNQFSLGAFDISFLFMYYGGHVMRVQPPNPNGIAALGASNPLLGSDNFWKQPGDETKTIIPGFSPATSSAPGYYQTTDGYDYASRFVRKADYIRLRDLIVTYNIKGALLNKMRLRNTQLRLQMENAFRYTFSGNDIDPDAINRITGARTLPTQPFSSLTFSTNF